MLDSARSEDFAALYAKHHTELLRYVLTLLGDRTLAEDVVQDTARLLWQKFDQYDTSQPFGPWARRFAYYEVLKVLKKQSSRGKYFSEALVETLAAEREECNDLLAVRREALTSCLEKLDPPSRELLLQRFGHENSIQTLAQRHGKSANSLYLAMHRIRQKLLECVTKTLGKEGMS